MAGSLPAESKRALTVAFVLSACSWLDGHWGGRAGVALHQMPTMAFVTSETDRHGTSWVLSASQTWTYRSQAGASIDPQLCTSG